jgi:hypothetical protein
MEWAFDYLEKDRIVTAKITGLMDWDSHEKFAQEMFAFASKNKSHKILIDFFEMTPNFTILQIDDMPKLMREIGFGPEFRIAALYNPSSPKSNEFTFFKNVASIMSLRVQQFSDKEKAIAWLKSQ